MAKEMNYVTVILIVLAVVIGWQYFQGSQGTSGSGSGSNTGGNTIITSAATLNTIATDALQAGTSVGVTTNIATDGSAFRTGVTSASQGTKLDVLFVNSTTYHNSYITGFVVPNKPTADLSTSLKANATVTMTVFNTNAVALTDGGGAVNQTVAAGGSYNMKVRMDGQDKKSSQDMRCILETTASANVSNIVLSGFGAKASPKGLTSKPNWYTLAGTGSGVYVYDIDEVSGAVSPEGTASINSATSKTLSATQLKINCYTKEWFLDTNTGKVVFDVEDSLGNLKSIAKYGFTVQFT